MVTPGDATAAVIWNEPSLTCSEAIRSTSIAPTGTKQGQLFSIGQHTIVYTYRINEKLHVRCPVMLEVRGKRFNERWLIRNTTRGKITAFTYYHQFLTISYQACKVCAEKNLKRLHSLRSLNKMVACYFS